MIASHVQAIILAAGKATRFKTDKSKLIEKLCGQEMILYSTAAVCELGIEPILVVGYQKDKVMDTVTKVYGNQVQFAIQEKQEGTGHAVLCSKSWWTKDHILIINGDMPLVTSSIIQELIEHHQKSCATITFVVAHNIDPTTGAYGRIVRTGDKIAIVEAKEFHADIHDFPLINAGIYLVERSFLDQILETLARSKVTNELYITDLVEAACNQSKKVETVTVPFDRVRGINTFNELAIAEQILRSDIINHWMSEGVRFSIPGTNNVDGHVTIGAGTYIEPGVQLLGATVVGKFCHVKAGAYIVDSQIDDNVCINPFSIIENLHVKQDSCVEPYSHISCNKKFCNCIDNKK